MKSFIIIFFSIGFTSGLLAQIATIGSQKWMSKNLDVSTFRNGEIIPQSKYHSEWLAACENKQPTWCYYNFDSANGPKYGKLYNWYAVNDSRGLAPSGYHIPTHNEWELLYKNLGNGCCGSTKLKSKNGWYSGDGTNQYGFSALPSGSLQSSNFLGIGTDTEWWSSTDEGEQALTHLITYSNGALRWAYEFKSNGHAVRCLKN
jgi:uncharacterized protein (TIGR02145 family)